LNALSSLLRPIGPQLLLATVACAVSGVASMLLVALVNGALSASADELGGIGLRFAAVSVLALSSRWLSEERFARLGQALLARLRQEMSRRIAALSYREFEQRGPANLGAALIEDANTVAQASTLVPGILINVFLVLGSFGYMAYLSLAVFAGVAVVLVAGVIGYLLVERLALRTLREARRVEEEVFQGFGALLGGAKELRLHAGRRREFLKHGLGAAIDRVRALRSRGLSVSTAASSVGSFLFFVVIGIVAFVLGRAWGLGREIVSGYVLVFLYLMFPLESLLGALPTLERARVALEHIGSVAGFGGDAALEREVSSEALEPTEFRSLKLEGVRHRYRHELAEGEFELGPLDLEIVPGEVTFLIGGNGSGKTTLAKLLVGLYAPEQGSVRLNGVEVTESTRDRHRACCTAVFSDFHLFDRLWGLASEELLAEASTGLERLELARRVRLDGDRFSTTALSQGQRKRLAFLVACLEGRPIVLFDEWAADQDPAHKDIFDRQLVPALARQGKAVVVVTHDDRYFELGDRCLKLEFGRLAMTRPASSERVAREGRISEEPTGAPRPAGAMS
jgi:putative ATP-binding cassette transporter